MPSSTSFSSPPVSRRTRPSGGRCSTSCSALSAMRAVRSSRSSRTASTQWLTRCSTRRSSLGIGSSTAAAASSAGGSRDPPSGAGRNPMTIVLEVDRPLLLDGGTGRELLKRGVPILTEIWSATALYLAPEIVKSVHADFIRAGADIITTNTYGIARERLAREGVEDRYGELNRAAGEIA